MADNNNRGSSDAFRRRQEARRRREPQTIDAKAQDVTTSPVSDPSSPSPQRSASEEPLVVEATSDAPPDAAPMPDTVAGFEHRPVVPPSPELPSEAAIVSPSNVTDEATRAESMSEISRSTRADEAAVADSLPWLDPKHRPDKASAAPVGSSAVVPAAAADPVPVSDFVRPSNSEAEAPAFGAGAEPSGAAHANPIDGLPGSSGVGPGASEPMSEAAKDIEAGGAGAGEAGKAVDPAEVPSSTALDPASVAHSAPPYSDLPPSPKTAGGFGDTPGSAPVDRSRRQSFVPAALAGLAVLIIAGLAGLYYGTQSGGSAELAAKVDMLTQRVAALEGRPAAPTPTVDLGALQTRSTALDSDVSALKTAVADLTTKLGQTTQAATDNSSRIAALEQHAAASPAGPPAAAAAAEPPVAAAEPPVAAAEPPVAESGSPPAVPTPATPPTIVSPPTPAGSGDAGTSPTEAPPPAAAVPPPAVAAAPPAQSAEPVGGPELVALTGKVEDLAKRLAALPTEVPAPIDLSPLQGRIAELASRLEAQQAAIAALPRVDEARLDGRLTASDQRIDDTGRHVAELAQAVAAIPKLDLAPLQASIADVDARLKPVEAALAVPKTAEQVTEARAVGSIEESRAAPLAVVAGAISRALNDGRPFGPELDALRAMGIEDAALGPLPVLAGPGAPTAETLRDRWADIQTKVLTAAEPKTGDSVLDRFAAGARTLVQVRQVGTTSGDAPSAASSRIGPALDRGDIADALGEWAKLPEASRTASQGWADAARSRLEADASVQALMVRAIAALAPPKN